MHECRRREFTLNSFGSVDGREGGSTFWFRVIIGVATVQCIINSSASVSGLLELHPVPVLRIHRQVGTEQHFLFLLAQIVALRPLRRGEGLRASLGVPNDIFKSLQKADSHKRYLVVRELLTEADPRSCVEWEEDKWVWNEILLHPLIQETIGIEFQCVLPP